MLGLYFKPIKNHDAFAFAVEDYLTFEGADPDTNIAAVQMEDNTDDFELQAFFSMASAAQAKLVVLGYNFLSDDIAGDYFDHLIETAGQWDYKEIPNVYEDRIVFAQGI